MIRSFWGYSPFLKPRVNSFFLLFKGETFTSLFPPQHKKQATFVKGLDFCFLVFLFLGFTAFWEVVCRMRVAGSCCQLLPRGNETVWCSSPGAKTWRTLVIGNPSVVQTFCCARIGTWWRLKIFFFGYKIIFSWTDCEIFIYALKYASDGNLCDHFTL